MNQYQLVVKAQDRLGVLERIFRVIRHRGARIDSMSMNVSDQILCLTMTLVTNKSIDALDSQLTKLVDVISIEH